MDELPTSEQVVKLKLGGAFCTNISYSLMATISTVCARSNIASVPDSRLYITNYVRCIRTSFRWEFILISRITHYLSPPTPPSQEFYC